jgi:hypothetical protein
MAVEHAFADWAELVAYVRAFWRLEAIDEDGLSFERQWEWASPRPRSQLVTIARADYGGEVWVSWAAAIADDNELTDEQIFTVTAAEVGRVVRAEGCCWLEQHLPLALLTPTSLEHYSNLFAKRADDLELELTGTDRD